MVNEKLMEKLSWEGGPSPISLREELCMTLPGLYAAESAKAGGGYILGVGDQTPYHTPEDNLYAFVEYGKKYGRY